MIAMVFKYGSSVLRKKSVSVLESDDINSLTINLFQILKKEGGIGLASPQIGVLKRIFVINTSPIVEKDNSVVRIEKVYINPSIIWKSEESIIYSEGCLSIPEIYEEVERPLKIRAIYHDLQFNKIEKEIEGIEARIFQHEFDHLDGILFIDKINPLRRKLLKSRLKRIEKDSINY